MRSTILLTAFLCYFFCTEAQYTVQTMRSGGVLHPLQSAMDIRHYTLSLNIDPVNQAIEGYGLTELILAAKADTLLINLAPFYKISEITVNNTRSNYTWKGDQIFITTIGGFNAGKHTIKIDYAGKPPVAADPPWSGGFSWTKDSNNNPWIAINCQMEGGKIYFPCKDHPSDEPDEGVDLYISVPLGLSVAGPGLLAGTKRKNSTTATWHWKTLYPISNYCILFNIGKYKVYKRDYTTINGNTVPMQFYVLEVDSSHAEQVLDVRARDTRILEKYFGEYPWVREKIGIAEVPNPGMEHQTMITFANDFKFDTINGQLYSQNLYHEFGHEWWANKVTNRDWAHIWIQEGIGTYAEALFFLEVGGEKAYDSVMLGFKKDISNEQPIVPAESADTRGVDNGDIYMKGAYFMHALRFITGDVIFFPTLKKLATDSVYTYYNSITTDDVEKLFSRESGRNLKPFFDFFLKTNDLLMISLKQTSRDTYELSSLNSPMTMPIDITTAKGNEKFILSREKTIIRSTTVPVIDPRGWYLKKIEN